MAIGRTSAARCVGLVLLATLAGGLLSACSDDEASADSPACGILDRSTMEQLTGDVDVVADGELAGQKERQESGIDCQIGSNGKAYLIISAIDTTDAADHDRLHTKLEDEVAEADACEALSDADGYVCRSDDKTELSVLFDDRLVRVLARQTGTDSPDPDVVLDVAKNVDKNITAYDADH